MQFASALSTAPRLDQAIGEVVASLGRPAPIDLCVVFASPHYRGDLELLPALLGEHLHPRNLIGCTGGGIIGGGREVEGGPALSVTVAALPGVEVKVCHVHDADLPDPDTGPAAWVDRIGARRDAVRGMVVLPEPFSFDAARLLAGLDFAYPGIAKVGGIASGGRTPDSLALFAGRQVHRTGAIVASLSGALDFEPLVAQGCKPFGRIGTITAATRNRLQQVDQQPALAFLEDQLATLDEADRELAATRPVFLGIAMDPFVPTEDLGPGAYLIRNLIGMSEANQTLDIGEMLAHGRRVQFHLMDDRTSSDDLRTALQRHRARRPAAPAGALLFSCLGRGRHLFGEADHDSNMFRSELADVPLGGFFCNGEIGPVGGATHLHGYTSAFAVLGPRSAP